MPTHRSLLLWVRLKGTESPPGEIALDESHTLLVRSGKYLFPNSAAFSIFPPFYYGIVSVSLGWGTLVAVLLMHIMCFVKKCDNERSGWSYCYLLYHIMIGIWMLVSLLLGYYWSTQQPLATDTNEGWLLIASYFYSFNYVYHANIKIIEQLSAHLGWFSCLDEAPPSEESSAPFLSRLQTNFLFLFSTGFAVFSDALESSLNLDQILLIFLSSIHFWLLGTTRVLSSQSNGTSTRWAKES
jgi:hypothetical protein